MTSVPPESIISGVALRAVNGRPPQRDGDFDGEISLSLVYSSGGSAIHHKHTIQGLGLVCDGGIFVNEKDGHGKTDVVGECSTRRAPSGMSRGRACSDVERPNGRVNSCC